MSELHEDRSPSDDIANSETKPPAWPPAPTSPDYDTLSGQRFRQRFVPATSAARWAIGAIAVCLFVEFVYGVIAVVDCALLRSAHIATLAITLYRCASGLAVVDSLVYIVAGVIFLRWFYLAYRNLGALGAEQLPYTPAWSVIWFFIPVLNLYKPYVMVATTWKASDPSLANMGAAWQRAKGTAKVGIWWVIWLFGQFLGGVVSLASASRGVRTWANEAIMLGLTSCYCSIDIAAGILLISIVRQIGRRQEEAARRLGTG